MRKLWMVCGLVVLTVATFGTSATLASTQSGHHRDRTAPSTPTNVQATAGDSQVDVSWSASTDPDSAVAGYYVLRDGVRVAQTSSPGYTDTGLTDGTTYAYTVEAFDRAGNVSAPSSPVSATPQATTTTDTTSPSVPAGVQATPGDAQVQLSWSASTDPDSPVAGYYVYRDGTQLATVSSGTSYTDTGLTNGTSYSYTIAAYDPAGNVSAQSSFVSTTPQASPTNTGSGPCGKSASAPTGGYQHVVWIVMENHASNEIVGNSAAPYENQLASQCGLATNYLGISHPSLPNYIAMTSGSTQGIADDNPPSSHPLNVPSIFSQLPGGQSRSLEESMPSNCDQSDSGNYAVKHNPEAYYTNLGSDCANYDVPLGATPDLSAKFTFVTPNLCDDMHDCSVSTGDAWLQSFMSQVFQTPAWTAGNTAVFITFDEDDGTQGNQVYTAVVAPSVTPGTQSATAFDHYSLLRTAEDLLGLSPLGGAATATPMESAFNLG